MIDDNLFEWHVRLYSVGIDPESPLAQDMLELQVPSVLLHLIFPDNFPFAPPFMRVVEPRIEKGFVMEGGAICMELLTPRGRWLFVACLCRIHSTEINFLHRLGFGVYHRSDFNAVCGQLSEGPGENLPEKEGQPRVQP